MSTSWFYVEGNDRVGPITEEEIAGLISNNKLNEDSYVWCKGFDNWKRVNEVPELVGQTANDNSRQEKTAIEEEEEKPISEMISDSQKLSPQKDFNWNDVDRKEQIFSLKIGVDRGVNSAGTEYGPFSLELIKKLLLEKRVNEKTYIFTPGMPNWTFLGDIPIYEEAFSQLPPLIDDNDRRKSPRRPFVARMFFHDNGQVFEGICRDISVGGMQILVSNFPGEVGGPLSMNVHPDNSEHHFVASGKVVRFLPGNQGISFRFTNLNENAKEAINSYIDT